MKIPGDKPDVIQTYSKKTREEEKVSQGKKPEELRSRLDEVEISREAREKKLEKIKGLLDKVPEVREEKVAALKLAIEDGTYRVKGMEIAKKMIKEGVDEFV